VDADDHERASCSRAGCGEPTRGGWHRGSSVVPYEYLHADSQWYQSWSKIEGIGLRAKLIYLTIRSDCDFVHACMNAGAFGYVLKCRMDTELLLAVSETEAGREFLSHTFEREN